MCGFLYGWSIEYTDEQDSEFIAKMIVIGEFIIKTMAGMGGAGVQNDVETLKTQMENLKSRNGNS